MGVKSRFNSADGNRTKQTMMLYPSLAALRGLIETDIYYEADFHSVNKIYSDSEHAIKILRKEACL